MTLNRDKKRKLDLTANTGIVFNDGQTLKEFVIANSMISIWRPVNRNSAKLLSQQFFMGKGLNVKAKSSEFGPVSGFIPFDVHLSKIAGRDITEINAAQKKNDDLIMRDQIAIQSLSGTTQKIIDIETNDKLLVTKIPLTIKLLSQNDTALPIMMS
jgi:hypothetical protein